MSPWSFVLTDLDLNPIGEVLNAYDRGLTIGLSRSGSASFTVRPDNQLLVDVFAGDTLLQVWQGSTLRFWGPLVSAQYGVDESGTNPTVAINATSPAWRLALRLAGKSGAGTAYNGDKAATAKTIIDVTNAENDTEILTTTVSCGSTGTYTAGPYKPVLTCISELANAFDGFDWYLTPLSDTAGKIARFDAAANIGVQQDDTVFEYGVGRHNVRQITYLRDLGGIMNQAYHIPDAGAADPSGVKVATDATSITYRGLYESVVDSFGLVDATIRQNWVDENVAVRRDPRRVISMTPDFEDAGRPGRIPELGNDYFLGDFVHARGQIFDTQLFDGFVRVYAVSVSVDNNGTATVVPTLVDEDSEAGSKAAGGGAVGGVQTNNINILSG